MTGSGFVLQLALGGSVTRPRGPGLVWTQAVASGVLGPDTIHWVSLTWAFRVDSVSVYCIRPSVKSLVLSKMTGVGLDWAQRLWERWAQAMEQ